MAREIFLRSGLVAIHDGKVFAIMDERRGKRSKFWLSRGIKFEPKAHKDKAFLIKYALEGHDMELWGEVLSSKIYNKLGIDCVNYDLVWVVDDKKGIKRLAVICPNYMQGMSPNAQEVSVFRLFNEHREYLYDNFEGQYPKLNYTISDITQVLMHKYGTYDGIEKTLQDLQKLAIIDFLTYNQDRHWYNITFIADHETKQIRMAPVYDNGGMLDMDKLLAHAGEVSHRIRKNPRADKMKGISDVVASFTQAPPMLSFDTQTVEIDFTTHKKCEIIGRKDLRKTCAQEMAMFIKSDSELKAFYDQAKRLDMLELVRETEREQGEHILDRVTDEDVKRYIAMVYDNQVTHLAVEVDGINTYYMHPNLNYASTASQIKEERAVGDNGKKGLVPKNE